MRRHGRICGHASRDRRGIPPRRRGGRRPNSEGPRSPVDRPRLHRPRRPRDRVHPRPNRGGRVGSARIRRALVLRHLLRKPPLRAGWIPCEAFPPLLVPRRRRSLRIPRGPTFRFGCVAVAGPPRIVFDARDDPRVPTVLSRADPPRRGRCQGADHPRLARARVPGHGSVPAHDPRPPCRNFLACDVSLLARRLGGCCGPLPRRPAGPPPPGWLSPPERNPDISAALSLFQQWFDGQSGGDTPGPIPNPEVKPAHVPCGSAVREPARSLPSFEEGLGRRPRYASRPSLWWTTNRAAITAVGPWNAVSHSLFLLAALGSGFQPEDD